jgi:hypothetical protein
VLRNCYAFFVAQSEALQHKACKLQSVQSIIGTIGMLQSSIMLASADPVLTDSGAITTVSIEKSVGRKKLERGIGGLRTPHGTAKERLRSDLWSRREGARRDALGAPVDLYWALRDANTSRSC